jgi:hypothetical protein
MKEAQRLRQEAESCTRLAETIVDARAARALMTLAAEYLDKAQRLERQEMAPPTMAPSVREFSQQQRLIRPKEDGE